MRLPPDANFSTDHFVRFDGDDREGMVDYAKGREAVIVVEVYGRQQFALHFERFDGVVLRREGGQRRGEDFSGKNVTVWGYVAGRGWSDMKWPLNENVSMKGQAYFIGIQPTVLLNKVI